MAITATTLSAAITASQTSFGVASATGISAPNYTTGAQTYLKVEDELMAVTGVVGNQVSVRRGIYGTQAVAHSASVPVLSGAGPVAGVSAGDFPSFTPANTVEVQALPNRFVGVGAPVAAAATLAASGAVFHVTGTTASSAITPPANFVEGEITVIADAIWTWTSTTAANGIAQAGTVTSAGTHVRFVYDAAKALWYPSRVA